MYAKNGSKEGKVLPRGQQGNPSQLSLKPDLNSAAGTIWNSSSGWSFGRMERSEYEIVLTEFQFSHIYLHSFIIRLK